MRSDEEKTDAMQQVWIEFFEKKLHTDYDGIIYIPERFDMVTEFVAYMCNLTAFAIKGQQK